MEYFQIKGWHTFLLDVNSLLPKVTEISFIAKWPNALITRISELKVDESILKSKIDIVGYDVIWMEQSFEERRWS